MLALGMCTVQDAFECLTEAEVALSHRTGSDDVAFSERPETTSVVFD
jgi:hypothetical protein